MLTLVQKPHCLLIQRSNETTSKRELLCVFAFLFLSLKSTAFFWKCIFVVAVVLYSIWKLNYNVTLECLQIDKRSNTIRVSTKNRIGIPTHKEFSLAKVSLVVNEGIRFMRIVVYLTLIVDVVEPKGQIVILPFENMSTLKYQDVMYVYREVNRFIHSPISSN